MCPSYQATRDEAHSTRGRANALRAVLSGALPVQEIEQDGLHDILDLCLECKGCKAECPTAVDMARIKSAFLELYQRRHGVPLRSRLFADIRRLTEIGSRLAGLVNRASGSALARRLQEPMLGISRHRHLPRISSKPFKRLYKNTTKGGEGPPVILFLDTYTNALDPSLGQAACKLLVAAGYTVRLVEKQGCCGRPSISKGLLSHAKKLAQANLAALGPYAAQDIPIIGLEPSCLLTLRDEYLDLFPGDARAVDIARNAWLLEEFLLRPDSHGEIPIERSGVCPGPRPAGAPSQSLFCEGIGRGATFPRGASHGRLPRWRKSPPAAAVWRGLSDMKLSTTSLSMKIAEQSLLPAAREAHAAGSLIAAGGISCRTQLLDGAKIESYHPIKLLADALVSEG